MFKKPATVETKSEKQLSGKDVKTLKRELEEKHGDIYSSALTKQLWWRKNRISSFLYTDEGIAILFTTEGIEGYLPSLDTVWKFGTALPVVTIHPPVSQFICRGADLMFPGVRKPFPTVEKEEIVQIQIEGNPKSIAIGRATQGHEHWNALTTREGVCVEVIHFFGDCLWEKNGAQFPPGFKRDQVERIAEQQPTEVQDNLPTTEGEEIASGAESESEGEEKNDDLLYKCLLMALRHTKDKELPMGINEVYQRMRKCRPPNSSIDVKKTSWKKLLPFLRSCEESGLCSMSKDGEKLQRIRRDHESLSSFEPWELADEAEVDFSSRCLLVETVWVVPERLRTLWEKQVITAEECDEGIRLYANSKDLWMANNRKRIGPDSLLECLWFSTCAVI